MLPLWLTAAFALSGAGKCPGSTTAVDKFEINGTDWTACEDLQVPNGAIVLVPRVGEPEWFPKSYSHYGGSNDQSPEFYLGLGKYNVTKAKDDALGVAMLSKKWGEITWDLVASAVPVIKATGMRAFVGSRSSVADTTFSDLGEDASGYGFPPPRDYVFNLTNIAEGGLPFSARDKYINASGMGEGLVGGALPVVVFYFPVDPTSKVLPKSIPAGATRYWTMVAAPTPDMQGSREQGVWFRFVQVECAGAEMAPPCKQVGTPQYWDTYWWTRTPAGRETAVTGPTQPAMASGFYATLLENRRWWTAELAKEGMMEVELPSSSKTSTNGTWLGLQARHNIIVSMITKHDTWGPRYGVLPGYGITMQNGFEDVFTSLATAATEWGMVDYSKGLIDNQFDHYIRDDGLTNYRANEVAQQARMLTILALYHSYSGDDATLLRHFAKAKALADWLRVRRETSLAEFTPDDPRYGLIAGLDEGDSFVHVYFHQGPYPVQYWYSHIAEAYRAFTEIGQIWADVGKRVNRPDVAAHGAELLTLAPDMYKNLHASLDKTLNTTASPGHKCWPDNAGMFAGHPSYGGGCSFRAYPEMFYSGALTAEQTDAMYTSGQGVTNCSNAGRWLTDGSPSSGDGLIFTHIPQGMPFGLLVHDFVERFLLYFFHQSAHAQTRGTWVSPESTKLDRDGGGYAYASAGEGNILMGLKWMLCFEEPETRTLWLAKATPRDWLAPGEDPITAAAVPTRYGRIAFTMAASGAHAGYAVAANVTLPVTFGTPAGGLRLRLRAPLAHAGKLSKVTIGGKAWTDFDAAEETVNIAASKITRELIVTGLPNIVAVFSAAEAVPLRPARLDTTKRVVPVQPQVNYSAPAIAATAVAPACPDDSTMVDSFSVNGTVWTACEDLQRPGGDIVLVSSAADERDERFTKGFAPYTANSTDDSTFYLGLTKEAVANATTDILGAKLLQGKALTWAAVERAVPPIRSSGRGGSWESNCKGVRTFVGSRGAAVDTTFDDHGGDCNWEGWPSWESYAINMHNQAIGAPIQAYNSSASADGNVGGVLPTAVFYLPMFDNGTSVNRYWTYFAAATPDICPTPANGCREQAVLFRFQQVQCSGTDYKPPCKMVGWPMYWNSYWYSRFPGANATDTEKQTLLTGPVNATSSSEFYTALLANRRWWDAELANEGMMALDLPSPATTNGTWLVQQSIQTLVRSMITRENTWHPRYGVKPGYGDIVHDGLLGVFTATATAALEWGAMPYARGVIDNQFSHYVRSDGMVWYRAVELPAAARMLTILALYHSYSGDATLLLKHFPKAEALAGMLIARRAASLQYAATDPRYGIPFGGDAARDGVTPGQMNHDEPPPHWYASAAELYRAFTEAGAVWVAVGKAAGRSDVAKHGEELLQLAPELFADLQASLNRTLNTSATGERCWQLTAEQPAPAQTSFRGFAEMMYSGALSAGQVADIYAAASGGSGCGATRFLTLGSPGLADSATFESTSPYGFAYGLLQSDMVERFLLHFFTCSAHGYTRGTFTNPESSNLADRDEPTVAYTAAGVAMTPIYLKWMLCFEDPETKTLWLGKAVPRSWLAVGEAPLVASNLTTRYGRVSFRMAAAKGKTVQASATLPAGFATAGPAGGVRIRVRAPPSAGKLSTVTLGGRPWAGFNAADETIDVDAAELTAELIAHGLTSIVATFG